MPTEWTPGKFKLRAVEPGSRRPLIERYVTWDAVAARRAALEQAGSVLLLRSTKASRAAGAPEGRSDG